MCVGVGQGVCVGVGQGVCVGVGQGVCVGVGQGVCVGGEGSEDVCKGGWVRGRRRCVGRIINLA